MVGDRIKQARIAGGMTQDQVVAALAAMGASLTKGGLSKYERGGSTPKPTVMRALASVLGVETSYFLEEPSMEMRWQGFRKGSRLGKKGQDRVKALAEAQIEVFVSLKHSLEPATVDDVLPQRAPVRKPEDAECAADRLREHWCLGNQAIESVTAAIEDGGGLVLESGGDEDLFDGLSGWMNDSVPVIVVSWAVSDDRRRFSLAHELGHLLMDAAGSDARTEEKYAHRFAAASSCPIPRHDASWGIDADTWTCANWRCSSRNTG